MHEVVTFGEAMIRLSPPGRQRIEQAVAFESHVAGAELNVAVAVTRLGHTAAWVSRLPDNPLGRMIAQRAAAYGVETTEIIWASEGRLGLFFLEVGVPPRPSAIIYDRAGSAFAHLSPREVDWERLLRGTRVFHTTGITPAVSEGCAAITREALAAARRSGCLVTFDLNYRSLLWSAEAAHAGISQLLPCVDVLVGSLDDARAIFGLEGSASQVAEELRRQLSVATVVVSQRLTASDGRQVRHTVAVGEGHHEAVSPEFETVDPVGGGDALCAGLITGLLEGSLERGLQYGAALAALKQTIPGDLALVSRAEVEELVAGGAKRTRR